LNPNDHVYFSNRSGAYASLNQYEEALSDANKCVEIKPDWAKGYGRKGLAEFKLGET
jgi:stress-induced-phosphoprotein 1